MPLQDMAQGHSMVQHSLTSQLVTKAAKVINLLLKEQDMMQPVVPLHISHRRDILVTSSQPRVDIRTQIQRPVISRATKVVIVVGRQLSQQDTNNRKHQAINLPHSQMVAIKNPHLVDTVIKVRGDMAAGVEEEDTRATLGDIRVVDTREIEILVDIRTVEVEDTEVAMEVADQIGVDTVVVVMVINLAVKSKNTRRIPCLFLIFPKM